MNHMNKNTPVSKALIAIVALILFAAVLFFIRNTGILQTSVLKNPDLPENLDFLPGVEQFEDIVGTNK